MEEKQKTTPNEETELNIDIQTPLAPNSGTNVNIYRTAPIPSITHVPRSTLFINLASPDIVFRLKASCISNRSPMPIFLLSISINPDIIVMTPRPPICIRSRITICPKKLQVVAVGRVTSPVTQVAVVAVNKASVYDTVFPSAQLIGSDSSRLPIRIVIKKLSNMICVVDNDILLFLTIN